MAACTAEERANWLELVDEPDKVEDIATLRSICITVTLLTLTSAVGHSFIRVDALVELLAIEKVLQQLLDLWDTSGTTNQDDVMDLTLVHLGVTERLLDWVQGATEEVSIELLKAGPGDGGVEVDSLVQGVDLDAGLGAGGERALCPLASGAQTTDSPLVVTDVLLVLALELCDEVVHHAVVEIFPTKMSVTSGGLDLKDTIFNGQDGHVEGTATEIEDEDVPLSSNLQEQTKMRSGL